MAQKQDCLAPARFRLVLALQSLLWLLVFSCQLKVLALIFKAINGLGHCYSEHCVVSFEQPEKHCALDNVAQNRKHETCMQCILMLKIANHKANFHTRLDKTQVLSDLERAANLHSWVPLSHYLSDLHTNCFLKSFCPHRCYSLNCTCKEVFPLDFRSVPDWWLRAKLLMMLSVHFVCPKGRAHTSTLRWRKTVKAAQQTDADKVKPWVFVTVFFFKKHTRIWTEQHETPKHIN